MKRQSYKNSKNDYSCLLGQHVGVMLENNEEVREKKIKRKVGWDQMWVGEKKYRK